MVCAQPPTAGHALHPLLDGPTVHLGYDLYQIAQAPMLADGHGETEVQFSADGDDGVGVEATAGPHSE